MLPKSPQFAPLLTALTDEQLECLSADTSAELKRRNLSQQGWWDYKTVTRNGKEYGPYWYWRWRDENGKQRSKYVGKTKNGRQGTAQR